MSVSRLPVSIVFILNFFIGSVGNGILILCFFKNPKFRTPFNILVTILCFCDILNLSGAFSNVISRIADFETSQSNCFFIQIGPIIGVSGGSSLTLIIGVDRFLAVRFPLWYRLQHKNKRYVTILLLFPLAYIFSVLSVGYYCRLLDFEKKSLCTFPVALNEVSFTIFLYGNLLMNIAIFAVYTGVYFSLRTHTTSTHFKKAFHSIAVTVTIVLFGYATTTIWILITKKFVTDPFISEVFEGYSAIPVQITLSTNVFVFYTINPDYRSTIRDLLHLPNQVHPSTKNSDVKMISNIDQF